MSRRTSRREFLATTGAAGLAGAGMLLLPERTWGDPKGANEKLNVAVIGAGGRGSANWSAVAGAGENIVAICDIDEKMAAKCREKFPQAPFYTDFRKMLEKEGKGIDAVLVSTPDHTHAVAGVMAMRMGKHVYCEKPLTHSVYEARLMKKVAAEMKVATSMGNQGTAENGLRTAVEVVQSGAIGPVKEVHVWTNRPVWKTGMTRPTETVEVPKTIDWECFIGPAAMKPYHPSIHPFQWRGYWDYGTGALGDMACHTANMAFMACKLGYPIAVEAVSDTLNPDTFPAWSTVTYHFPARGDLPPLKWVWYDGKRDGGKVQNLPPEEITSKLPKDKKKSKDGQEVEALASSGSVLIGEKGMVYSPNDYGASFKLLPAKDFEGYKPPTPTLPRSPGHHKEWINACKGGPAAMANFDYAAFLTEVVVLGNVAIKLGKKIDWDGPNMKATNCPEAEALVKPEMRKGWEL
jgi:predicted dehydrogenase